MNKKARKGGNTRSVITDSLDCSVETVSYNCSERNHAKIDSYNKYHVPLF